MSIWNVSVRCADRINVVGYAMLIVSAFLAVLAALFLENKAAILATVASATLTFPATLATFWASGVRDKHSDHLIADANAHAAKANERAAALELEAEQARAEQERLKTAMAWRRLSQKQRQILIEGLRGQTFKVWVTTLNDDPEARLFHQEIFDTLKAAGLETKWYTGYVMAVDLTVSDAPPEHHSCLVEAFGKAGLRLLPRSGEGMRSGDIEITVGTKPPAF